MKHNAHAETETVTRDNGSAYSRTVAVCQCGWTYAGGASSDRLAQAHNATEAEKFFAEKVVFIDVMG